MVSPYYGVLIKSMGFEISVKWIKWKKISVQPNIYDISLCEYPICIFNM